MGADSLRKKRWKRSRRGWSKNGSSKRSKVWAAAVVVFIVVPVPTHRKERCIAGSNALDKNVSKQVTEVEQVAGTLRSAKKTQFAYLLRRRATNTRDSSDC